MKILVLGLDAVDPELLFGPEELPNLHRLMEFGAYGRIEHSDCPDPGLASVKLVQDYLPDSFQFIDVGHDIPDREIVHESYTSIDEEVGRVLESLNDETVLLVVSAPAAQRPGAFILAGPASPLSGEVQGVQLEDLAPTLLQLAGHEVPAAMTGRSLLTADRNQPEPQGQYLSDEELIRERLSGLGYI